MGQARLQLRMRPQIADLLDPKPGRFTSPHDERVGVVEAKIARHADAELRELFSHLIFRDRLLCLENFFADRAGVFRIEIDLPAAQCLPKNDRAAHSRALFHCEMRALQHGFCDLAEHV